jgi:hypothetical protein
MELRKDQLIAIGQILKESVNEAGDSDSMSESSKAILAYASNSLLTGNTESIETLSFAYLLLLGDSTSMQNSTDDSVEYAQFVENNLDFIQKEVDSLIKKAISPENYYEYSVGTNISTSSFSELKTLITSMTVKALGDKRNSNKKIEINL